MDLQPDRQGIYTLAPNHVNQQPNYDPKITPNKNIFINAYIDRLFSY